MLKKLDIPLLNLTNVGRDDVAPSFELRICRNNRSFTFLLSWYDVVCIVTRLRVGRSWVRVPVEPSDFFCPPNLSDRLWGLPSILFSGYWRFFPEVNWPMREGDLLPPSRAEVENEWSYTSTLFVCLHDLDRKNVYLLFMPYCLTAILDLQIARMLQVVRRR